MGFKWNYGLGSKGGQDAKEKKGDIVITDKYPEFGLKIKIKGIGDDLDGVTTQIVDEIDGLDEVAFSFSGPKEVLEESVKVIAKIIAKAGGQQTLDVIMDEAQKASH